MPQPDIEPLDRDINHCCPCVQRRFRDLVDLLDKQKIFLSTIETRRGPKRQKWYLEKQVTKTLKSKHLPQAPKGLSLAIDVVPVEYLLMKGWCEGGPFWGELGSAAEKVGLQWGFALWGWDKPHLQLPECLCAED